MSAAVIPFPKRKQRRRAMAPQGNLTPLNVAKHRIECAPPPTIERSAELLIVMALWKALPADVQDAARTTIRQTVDQFGDPEALAAQHIASLLK